MEKITLPAFIINFDIRLHYSKKQIFDLSGDTLLTVKSDSNSFKLNPKVICADPFLFVSTNQLFLFYEEQTGYYANGVIKMISTSDLINWTSPKTVLEESFHLSFPFIFEDKGINYMIPESCEDRSIRIYEFTSDDLTSCKLNRKIFDTSAYVDSSIIKENSVYYLFTTRIEKNNYSQLLFYSDSLNGNFEEHPKSPICIQKKYARNAGSVFKKDSKLYRPSQDCSRTYGEKVSIHEITILNQNDYQESTINDNILSSHMNIYPFGGHHFNSVTFQGKEIIATDIRRPYFNIFRIYYWIKNKLK